MCGELGILYLLLLKNFIVRKRHFVGSILELIGPTCLIAMVVAVRLNLDIEARHVKENTIYPILSKDQLVNSFPRSMVHLYYKPQTNFTRNFMKDVASCLKLPNHYLFGFDSEDAMVQSYELHQSKDSLVSVLAVDFTNTDDLSVTKKFEYTIRSSQEIPNAIFDLDSESLNTASDNLIDNIPFVTLQMCLDDSFINRAADGATKPTVVIQKLPLPPYDTISSNELALQQSLCMFGGLMFYVTLYLVPSYISAEKSSGVNTLLKMNGVKSYQNYLSWLVSGTVFSIIPIFGVTILLTSHLGVDQKPIYFHSDCSIIWFILFINASHVYAFCLHIASYFSKSWLAQMVATILPLLFNIVTNQLQANNAFGPLLYFGLLCPTVATMRIFDELNKRENELTGAHWVNIFQSSAHPTSSTTSSLGFIMVFSILGIILHIIAALYFDAVLASKYDVRKPLLFFFKYFKQNKVCSSYEPTSTHSLDGQPKILEPVADDTLTPGIQLRGLAKSYTYGWFEPRTVKAVDGISLDFYKGQITTLLGHNGAGKTTMFSILTGLTAPSHGSVYINGKDISTDLDTVRTDLGVCPQENVMFPDLTVLEQLRFIGMLKQKNKTRKELRQEVDDLLEKLHISEKRNVMPEKLSGGQKRRLCLGMALIGGASTILLDEPTSGMDPETSRGTWDIILKYRKQKTIIITTHCMEEADVLGDRIAIMHSGQMKCYGTPMFLKKFYGHNYHEVTLSTNEWLNKEKIRNLVGEEAKMNLTHHGRIVISIPFTRSLPFILDNIEKQKVELGVTGLSVSMITLNQVFLKAAKEDETSEDDADEVDGTEELSTKEYKYLTGWARTWQMILALLTKKCTYFKTDKCLFLTIMCGALLAAILPVIFTGSNSNNSMKTLNLGIYPNPETLIYSENRTIGNIYKQIIEQQGGTGSFTKAGVSLSNELLSRAAANIATYKSGIIVAGEFNSSSIINALYAGSATFSAPITMTIMSNLVIKSVAGDEYSIVTNIGDLPHALIQNPKDKFQNSVHMLTGIILFITILFHVVALFVKHPLLENNTKIKQLQQMTGVSSFMYWATMFIADHAFYTFVTIMMIIVMFTVDVFQATNFIRLEEFKTLLLLFQLFGINLLLLAYIHSFMRRRFHIVYAILSGVPLLFAFLVIPLHEILSCIPNAEDTSIILRRIFSLQPHVAFAFAYIKYSQIAGSNARCRSLSNRLNEAACVIGDQCCDMKCKDGNCNNPLPYFNHLQSVRHGGFEEFIVFLSLTPVILLAILWMLEQQSFAKLCNQFRRSNSISNVKDTAIDSAVVNEKSIVRQGINQRLSGSNYDDGNVFLAYELSKCYGKLRAVKEISFRVKKNECFGLLGVNGAGKSTAFRMLVGEELPSNGMLHRDAYNYKNNRRKYLEGMGYCPQTDALIPNFNAVQHLSMLARLRGIPNSDVASEVHLWITKLHLEKYAKYPSASYSGGNKRRLNIAMALIANPQMVFLDEPTTGVDPAARRWVWTVLQSCQGSGQSIVLTSHSMEECETLCNRLVIMVNGQLLCVGASQELKERFGAGFNIIIKLNPGRSKADFANIKKKIQTAFVCELKDEHSGYLFYHITDPKTTWVTMFEVMYAAKSQYTCIEDFTVSSSTLEQLFMQFARSSENSTTEPHASQASDRSPGTE